ncbi:MAG: DUF1810 domain-containing protein [Clostridia bacterium]|nr:DUF1810 domain-containing protein [Clostridia bacterium]MBR6028404.1 DUF1810 domain-containing protein [Clostridia bacterium]
MNSSTDLSRFTDAQNTSYPTALAEIRNGRKESHWMWYIFPQIRGLGHSATSQYYAIHDLDEAAAFLHDPFLGGNLLEICHALLALNTSSAAEVFGWPDDMKLRSSMTLFALVPNADPVFQQVLDKYFGGKRDGRTLEILGLS